MRRIALIALACALTPVAAMQIAARPPAPVAQQESEGARLHRIFTDSDEAMLKRQPLAALFRGDLRYADRLGDFYSDASIAAERDAARADLTALDGIDRAKLNATDRIAYDVFRFNAEQQLKMLAPDLVALGVVRPIDHMSGIQTFYPDIASAKGAAPFNTVEDYENNLKRNAQYAEQLDLAIVRFRQGMASGVVQPKLVVRNVIAQFDGLIEQGVEGSTFYGPVAKFPDGIAAADQKRLRTAYAAQIRDVLLPAERRMRDFLEKEYLPAATDKVGLSALPGGDTLYAALIEQNTTLPYSAVQVHTIGKMEVDRITRAMEKQKDAVGFKGSLHQFFDVLRTDPKFQPKSVEAIRDGYAAIEKRVLARIPEQFALVPKTRLELRPVPAYREKTDAAGSYVQGTPDGSRPGIFFYNTYDLPVRFTWGMETLFLHEAIPGHHFQISLAQENEALPSFMRFGGNTAYVEGWALYAESLWNELGMETDPYQRMGGLSDEMLRAMRLVVDTGIHAFGWTRDQAIEYMLANSPMSRTDATAEVERYIAIPGQALAYKIGQMTLSRLKAKAKEELGDRFDPREFHAQVLDTGSLPMPVLERKIDDWIAAKKG